MDWSNLKNVFTTKLKEAEMGIDKFVRSRSSLDQSSFASENKQSLKEDHSVGEMVIDSANNTTEDVNPGLECSKSNESFKGDLSQLRVQYHFANKILEDKIHQIEEKKKHLEKLKSISKYIRNGKPLTTDQIIQEFSINLANVENKYKISSKERDVLKKELQMHIDTSHIENLDAEIIRLKEEEVLLQNKSVMLDEMLHELREDITVEDKDVYTLNERCNTLCRELEEVEGNVKSFKDEEKKSNQLIVNINEIIKNSSNQLEDLQNKCKELDSQSEYMKSTFEKAESEKMALKKKYDETKDTHKKEVDELVNKLEHEYLKRIDEIKAFQENNEIILKEDVEALNKDIKIEYQKIRELKKESNQKIETLETELEDLELRSNNLSSHTLSENKPLLKQINFLQLKIAQKEEEIQNIQDLFQSNIYEIKLSVHKLTTIYNNISSACDATERKVSEKLQLIDDQNETIASLKEEASYLTATLKKLEDEHLSIEFILKERKETMACLNDDLTLLEDEYKKQKCEFDELDSKFDETRKELDEIVPLSTLDEHNNVEAIYDDTHETNSHDPLQIALENTDKEIISLIRGIEQTKLETMQLETEFIRLMQVQKDKEKKIEHLKSVANDFNDLVKRHNITLELLGERSETEEQIVDDMEMEIII